MPIREDRSIFHCLLVVLEEQSRDSAQTRGFVLWGSGIRNQRPNINAALADCREPKGDMSTGSVVVEKVENSGKTSMTTWSKKDFPVQFAATVLSKQQRCSWVSPAEWKRSAKTPTLEVWLHVHSSSSQTSSGFWGPNMKGVTADFRPPPKRS